MNDGLYLMWAGNDWGHDEWQPIYVYHFDGNQVYGHHRSIPGVPIQRLLEANIPMVPVAKPPPVTAELGGDDWKTWEVVPRIRPETQYASGG